MGCVLAKLSLNSPQRTKKTKMDRGNVVREHAVKRYQSKTEDERRNGRMVTRDGEREGKGPSQRLPPPRPLPGPAVGKDADQMANGWPKWLVENIPREVLARLVPRSAECYDKLDKVGHGTYSNVFKARDRETGKIVALKKVRFDTTEPESVKFMAREIRILQKLDHPNVIKLEGLATSRMDYSLYLVFDFMPSDLSRVISRRDERLTEPQVKCYMHQLLSGLQHCHERGILHRDIKGSNLLIDRNGMLKIADFGLANFFKPKRKRPLTSKVVTLWYRAPELLLGARDYGVGIDLWSAGCLLAEMFAGRPIMPGRTEIEQLHRIFKLCGSPSDDYCIKLKLSKSLRSSQQYKPSITEAFRDFPASSLGLLNILLALDPSDRQNASSALQNEFFTTSPLAYNLSDLPVIYKEEYNESIQPYERRNHRASKLSQMSHTQSESQRKKERAMVRTTTDSGSSKLEEQTAQLATHKLGSSTASISSAMQPKRYVRSPPTSPSSKAPQLGGQSRSTDGHPSATKNLPPLPSSETKDGGSDGDTRRMHRYGMDKSSVRSSSFGKLEGEHRSQNYDFDY